MGKDDIEGGELTPERTKAMTPSEKLIYIMNSINADFTGKDIDEVIDLLDEINSRKKR
jgi:hypothetical protein